jgi:hypothetical protein
MTDPLRWFFGLFFDKPLIFANIFPDSAILINGLLVTMVVLAIRGNLDTSEENREEKRWAEIHGDLIRRIERLMPVYRNTNMLYIRAQMRSLTGNKNVVHCMRSIKESVKQRAEIDFVMHDADRPENIAVLQEQLEKATEEKDG